MYSDWISKPMLSDPDSTPMLISRPAWTPEEKRTADSNGKVHFMLDLKKLNFPKAEDVGEFVMDYLNNRPYGAPFREIDQEAKNRFPQYSPDTFWNAYIILDAFGHIGVDGKPGPFCLGRSVEVARALLESHDGLWTAMQR